MKKWSVLVLGILVVSGGLLFARGGRVSPVAFTLVTPGGEALSNGSPRISFRLTGTSVEPAGYGEPAGSGDVEDSNHNTGYGIGTLAVNTGGYNTAIGWYALSSNTTSSNNTAIGCDALGLNTTGGYNTAIGAAALYANTTGNNNIAIGAAALYLNAGDSNIGIGGLRMNTTGGRM